MTGSNYLLDTNIVIEILSGNKLIIEKIRKTPRLSLCTTVLGELYVGVYRVTNKIKHEKKLLDFLLTCEVFLKDTITSQRYGEISASLFKKGKPIPSNDIWIASIAIQHDLTLISKDNHFKEVEGLKLEYWE